MAVSKRIEGTTGYVTLDNPPVNAIGQAMRAGLLEAVEWAEAANLTRVIVSGAGRAFAAGADAKEFDGPALEPHLPEVLDKIEKSFVPWVAAINGVALGGGLEIALACRARIAAPGALLGLPEVTLGVIPGAGGTQRLPRLVGLEKALEMITSSKPLKSKEALALKLVHEVADDPVEAAFMLNDEDLGCIVPVWELHAPEHDAQTLENARENCRKKMAGQIAPLRAIDVIEAGLSKPFDEAMLLERQAFLDLRVGDQARALRHIFFAERAAKQPESITAKPLEIKHVAVVGGGMMGAGIAYALLNKGLRVTLLETDSDAITRAQGNVAKLISASEKRGLISADQAAEIAGRITYSEEYSAAKGAELAIEAAFESMAVKKAIFPALESVLDTEAVLATNTSYLDVNEIAASLKDPSRLVGLHFFAPAHIMKLLEIVRGDATSDVALATGFALGKMLKKIPVLSGVCDGFIGNRILARYREAAEHLLMDGSNPWEVDEAMEAFGYAMGPYAAQDLSGLDIAHANRQRQAPTRDPNRRYVPISDRMVQEGRLGRKVGVGWYRYPGGGGKVVDPLVEDLCREEAHFAKVTRREIGETEITQHLLLAMINEAAAILDEGIAASARDIDLVTVFGYGFPRWRGGLMHYADQIGAKTLLRDLRALEAQDPIVWKVSPLIARLGETGGRFADV